VKGELPVGKLVVSSCQGGDVGGTVHKPIYKVASTRHCCLPTGSYRSIDACAGHQHRQGLGPKHNACQVGVRRGTMKCMVAMLVHLSCDHGLFLGVN
jgi:hypothetical protein